MLSAITRRDMLRLGAGQLLALGLWPGVLRAEGRGDSGEFTFIVVNDIHFQSERCPAWIERVVRQMNTTDPKPVLCLMLGDYSEHGTAPEIGGAKDGLRALKMPVFGVIGNHDYTEGDDRKAYEKLFPKTLNYAREQDGWQFIGLDTTEGRQASGTKINAGTLAWVDENLPKLDRTKPMVIFTHFPLGLLTPGRPKNADDLLIRFKEHNLQAVVSVTRPNWRSVKPWKWPLKTACRLCSLKRINSSSAFFGRPGVNRPSGKWVKMTSGLVLSSLGRFSSTHANVVASIVVPLAWRPSVVSRPRNCQPFCWRA